MVSVICNNALNRAVREYELKEPCKILDKTRELVLAEFEKSDDEVQDGMDIAICSLQNNQLQFSAANQRLWIIRNGKLIEYKGDKQPIGQFGFSKPFNTQTIQLEKGDQLYLFSDGYVDQFGGPISKKLKPNNLRRILLEIETLPLETQKRKLIEAFETWKGDLEQIDDVCIWGIKI